MTQIKNTCWKGSEADWVIVCDIDELIYHPDMRDFLYRSQNWTLMQPLGWAMWSDHFPTTPKQIWEEVKFGYRDSAFDKLVVFNPQFIDNINYHAGAHVASPKGIIRHFRNPEFKLLHFKYLGWNYYINRCKLLHAAAVHDIKKGMAIHYGNVPTEAEFQKKVSQAQQVVFPTKKKFTIRSYLVDDQPLLA